MLGTFSFQWCELQVCQLSIYLTKLFPSPQMHISYSLAQSQTPKTSIQTVMQLVGIAKQLAAAITLAIKTSSLPKQFLEMHMVFSNDRTCPK